MKLIMLFLMIIFINGCTTTTTQPSIHNQPLITIIDGGIKLPDRTLSPDCVDGEKVVKVVYKE